MSARNGRAGVRFTLGKPPNSVRAPLSLDGKKESIKWIRDVLLTLRGRWFLETKNHYTAPRAEPRAADRAVEWRL